MDPSMTLSIAERRREERGVWRAALLASALLHVLVLAFFPTQTVFVSPFAAAGPRANDPRAASGSMRAMNLAAPRPVALVAPLVPLVTEIEVEPIEIDEVGALDVSSLVGQGVGLEGPGLESGTGAGDGGTGEEGLYRMVPPTPRGMIIPPFNQRLRGSEVEVWVFVDERGRVVADSTQLRPPTSDRDFNRRLIREAAEWVFQPAMQGGKPVATWFPYRFAM